MATEAQLLISQRIIRRALLPVLEPPGLQGVPGGGRMQLVSHGTVLPRQKSEMMKRILFANS